MELGWIARLLITASVMVTAAPVAAQYSQVCRFNGQPYREGARVCSNGLEVLCSNGNWQNIDGKRCDDRGQYLNPDEYFVVQDPVVVVPAPLPPPGSRPPRAE